MSAGKRLAGGVLLVAAAAVGTWFASGRSVPGLQREAGPPQVHGYAYLAGEPRELFRPSAKAALNAPQPIRISRQAVVNAMRVGALPVTLADGSRYIVRMERAEDGPNGNWTAIGKVATRLGLQSAVLTFGRDGVFGTLPRPDGHTLHITTQKGVSTIALAGGLLPPGQTDLARVRDYVVPASTAVSASHGAAPAAADRAAASADPAHVAAAAPTAEANSTQPLDATKVDIDVLMLYTDDLVALRGSVSLAETEVTNLLAVANQAYSDSGTIVRLRLAGLKQVAYPEASTNHAALDAITNNTLSDGTDVNGLRDSTSADLVALIRPYRDGHGSCGVGWLGGASLSARATDRSGYSVSNVEPCGSLVLAHEIGHNLGSHHDYETVNRAASFQYGAYRFSFGYRQRGTPEFATVMSYEEGHPWIGQFSSPRSDGCGGAACGIQSQADNVRSINLMAPQIARFQDASQTVQAVRLLGGHVLESDEGGFAIEYEVRLRAPAPAGGVRFDIATQGGTATPGVDYQTSSLVDQVIAEGARSFRFYVWSMSDTEVEPEETVGVRVSNIRGIASADVQAFGTIVDDDPRVAIEGRLVFPPGVDPPTTSVELTAFGLSRNSQHGLSVEPPDFRFRLAAVRGAYVDLAFQPPAPFAPVNVHLPDVQTPLQRNIPMTRGAVISGRLTTPAGSPALTQSLWVQYSQNVDNKVTYASALARAPDFRYSFAVVPGAFVRMEVTPPAPYAPVEAHIHRTEGDTVRDIALQTVPSVTLWGFGETEEGGTDTTRTIGPVVMLSAPAPAGGVRLDVETVDGTATAGSDYLSYKETLEFAPGERRKDIGVKVFGDADPEGDERFRVMITRADGASIATPYMELEITDDDHRAVRGDSNRDGMADLLWHSPSRPKVDVWQMRGTRMTGLTSSSIRPGYRIAARGDFVGMPNEDRREDLIVVNEANTELWLWEAKASGTGYVPHLIQSHPGGDWTLLGAANIEGSRRSVLLWQSASAQRLEWWRLDNWGGSLRTVAGQALPGKYRLAAWGDFDGDAREDLVFRDDASTELWMWRSNGTGFEVRSMGRHPIGWRIVGADDIDGDRRADILWRNEATAGFDIWFMQGERWTRFYSTAVGQQFEIADTGDLDGDGRADLVWRDRERTGLWMWRSQPGDSFASSMMAAHPAGDWALIGRQPPPLRRDPGMEGALATDVDGDRKADLVWHQGHASRVYWWLMDGATRRSVGSRGVDASHRLAARTDLTGDGREDVVVRDFHGTYLLLWRNLGDGMYEVETIGAHPGGDWTLVAAGDVDGDGKADLVWQSISAGQLEWWRMDGAQRLAVTAQALPSKYRLTAHGDLDGDRRLDLVWQDDARTELWLWQARGDRFESVWLHAHPPLAWRLVAAADVNGDGRSDLVWRNEAENRMDTWLMQGERITGFMGAGVDKRYSVLATGDFDGDGRHDLVWRDAARTGLWMWQSLPGGYESKWIGAYPGDWGT